MDRLKTHLRLFIVLLYTYSSGHLHADQAADMENWISNFDFRVQSFRPIQNLYYESLNVDGEVISRHSLRFRSDGLSQIYEYSGPPTLRFFQIINGEEIEFAKIDLGSSQSPTLLIFLSSEQIRSIPNNRIKKVPLSNDQTPPRHVIFVNTMPQHFKAGIRDNDSGNFVTVYPGVNRPLPLPDNRQIRLALDVTNFGWQAVFGTTIPSSINETVFIILYPPMFPGGLDLRGSVIYIADRSP